jgi:1-acyl-sn-glycerol-3-phosphate acyltransferase
VFFERKWLAAFAAMFINALPVFRGVSGRRGLTDMRARLLSDQCIMLLFPEGTRTRTGEMNRFKPGVGMLVAGTPVPVIPCFLDGVLDAMPPGKRLIRPKRITIRVGPSYQFADITNDREGWEACAERLYQAVVALNLTGCRNGLDL